MNAQPGRVEEELVAFESGAIEPKDFSHREHLRLGFEMLLRYSFAETLQRFSAGLKLLALRAGKPRLYHETKTVAFLSLIAERSLRGRSSSWEEFIAANADLTDRRCLERLYNVRDLESETARAVFVLPKQANTMRAIDTYALVISLYVIWSSIMTLVNAHGHDVHGPLLAALEIVAAVLFCFRRTRTAGLAFLLGVFLIAGALEVSFGGVPMRFIYYAASALLVWWLTRTVPRPHPA